MLQQASGTETQQQTFSPAFAKPNPLTVKEFEYIVAERKGGRGCVDIAAELNRSGYTTPAGGKIHGCDVSQFCIRNGYRQNKPFKRMTAKKMRLAAIDKNLNIQIPKSMRIDLSQPSKFSQLPERSSETVPFPSMAEKYNKEFTDRNTAGVEHAIAENFIANVVMPNPHLTNLQKTRVASALLK